MYKYIQRVRYVSIELAHTKHTHLNILAYICVYVCIYICICIFTYIYVYMYMYIYIHDSIYTYKEGDMPQSIVHKQNTRKTHTCYMALPQIKSGTQ